MRGGAAVDAVSAALGDASQLLHVEVQEVPRGRVLVAHGLAADAVQPVEAVESEAPQHGVDGRAGEAERPGDAVWPEAGTVADGTDDALQLLGEAPRMAVGRRAAVLEARRSQLAVAADPLRDGGAGDAEASGDLGLGPAGLHLADQVEPGQRREARVTMCHGGSSLLFVL